METTSYPLWTLDNDTVTRLVQEGGIHAATGKAGGMLMFHGNLVHGSAGNITPYPRKIVYLTLNAVSNYIRTPTRPEFIAHRDFRPIVPVADDALLQDARKVDGGGVSHVNLHQLLAARVGGGEARARRADRRRQVRLDVSVAGSDNAGLGNRRHRRPVTGPGARKPAATSAGTMHAIESNQVHRRCGPGDRHRDESK